MPIYPAANVRPTLAEADAFGPQSVVSPYGRMDSGSATIVSGTSYFVAFPALRSVTLSKLGFNVRGTAAASVTLARLGLYTVSESTGDITLVARTSASTTLATAGTFRWAVDSLDTTGGYPASYTLAAGSRYAFGMVFVATTAPVVYGGPIEVVQTATALVGAANVLPWISRAITGQADLGTSHALTALSGTSVVPLITGAP